jgi:hypothetical protein
MNRFACSGAGLAERKQEKTPAGKVLEREITEKKGTAVDTKRRRF